MKDLSKIKDQKQEEIYKDAYRNVERIFNAGDVAGYAMVMWHMDGTVSSSHWAARGPIGRSMVPALVHDVLLKRIAVLDTKDDLEDENRIPKK